MMETTSAAKKYLSCMCGNVKGKRSTETKDNLTITSLSNGTGLRQLTRQSSPTSKAVKTIPNNENIRYINKRLSVSRPCRKRRKPSGTHWYRFGAYRVSSSYCPACAG